MTTSVRPSTSTKSVYGAWLVVEIRDDAVDGRPAAVELARR